MNKQSSQLTTLIDKKRELEFKLIDVNAKIKALTPETLGQHLDFNRNRSGRQLQLTMLEAEREALIEQIKKLDMVIAQQQQTALVTKSGIKPTLKKKTIHDRVEQLMDLHKDKKKSEVFGMVADERGEADEAVKKAYYDYEKDLQKERDRKARERKGTSGTSSPPESKDRKSPQK